MSLLKIFKYFKRPERIALVLTVGVVALQVFFDLQLPVYMSRITNALESGAPSSSAIAAVGWKMGAVVVGSFVCSCAAAVLTTQIALVVAKRIRARVFEATERFSLRDVGRFSIPSLLNRTTNDVTQVQWFLVRSLQAGIKAPILAVWSIRRVVETNAYWSATVVCAIIYLIVFAWIIAAFAMPRYNRIQTLLDDFNRIVRENLRGMLVVRAFNAADYQQKKFDAVNETISYTDLVANRIFALQTPGVNLAVNGVTLAIYWIGAALISSALTTGSGDAPRLFADMVVVSSYCLQIITAFLLAAVVVILAPRFQTSYRRIEDVLATTPEIQDGADAVPTPTETGTIAFENVSFRLNDSSAYILENVSFKIRSGETVGIVGRIGSGKSTIFNLATRLLERSSGTIRVDGIDVSAYPLETLRAKFGVATQKTVIFKGTVASNITFGNDDAPIDAIIDAGRAAQCAEFVEKLDGAWNAEIAQSGANLSGGQKQRLAIARALFADREIYFFDDSFSALDAKTEKTLRAALKAKCAGKTVVVASQKISSVKDADRILVLDSGRLVASGPHAELLETCRVYREIVASQTPEETPLAPERSAAV